MKKLMTLSSLIAILLSTTFTSAIADVDSNPALQEGLERTLNPQQYADVVQWANTSANRLQDLLIAIKPLSKSLAINQMRSDITNVVLASAPKNSEVYMRFVLNRATYIDSILSRSSLVNNSVNLRYQQLVYSINLALEYYQSEFQGQSNTISPAEFGLKYFTRLRNFSNAVFEQPLRIQIKLAALEFFYVDLARDTALNRALSHQIKYMHDQDEYIKNFQSTSLSEKERLIENTFTNSLSDLTQTIDNLSKQSQGKK